MASHMRQEYASLSAEEYLREAKKDKENVDGEFVRMAAAAAAAKARFAE